MWHESCDQRQMCHSWAVRRPGMIEAMTDAPLGRDAVYTILTTGYTGSTGPGVAATVSYVFDAGGM